MFDVVSVLVYFWISRICFYCLEMFYFACLVGSCQYLLNQLSLSQYTLFSVFLCDWLSSHIILLAVSFYCVFMYFPYLVVLHLVVVFIVELFTLFNFPLGFCFFVLFWLHFFLFIRIPSLPMTTLASA